MGYRFSERAAEDIYWMYERGKGRFGERAAENYFTLMLDAAEFAALHPLASPRKEQVSMEVRVRYFGSHLIVYRLDDPDIEILRVLHQLQDWQDPL